jgi:hypothetical protein
MLAHFRQPVASVLTLAILLVGSMGLGNGVVMRFDHHGQVYLGLAHIEHAVAHDHGADHSHHEFPDDADHDDLHRAVADARKGQERPRSEGSSRSLAFATLPSAPVMYAASPPLPPAVHARSPSAPLWGVLAVADLARLRAVVIQV